VPVLLVSGDTLSTVGIIDELVGKLRIRDPNKIEHAVHQFEQHLDLAQLDTVLGLV
jgi:BioD-like phosphotransacetylase family protein